MHDALGIIGITATLCMLVSQGLLLLESVHNGHCILSQRLQLVCMYVMLLVPHGLQHDAFSITWITTSLHVCDAFSTTWIAT